MSKIIVSYGDLKTVLERLEIINERLADADALIAEQATLEAMAISMITAKVVGACYQYGRKVCYLAEDGRLRSRPLFHAFEALADNSRHDVADSGIFPPGTVDDAEFGFKPSPKFQDDDEPF